jgi:hypothetical protein
MQSAKIQVSKGPRNESKGTRDLESVANGQEPVDAIPVEAEVVQAGVALGTVPAEAADEPIAVELGDRTQTHDWILELQLGILLPKAQEFLDCGRTVAFRFHTRDRVFRRDIAIEVEQAELHVLVTLFLGGEVFVRDVVVRPIVGLHQLLEGATILHELGVFRDEVRDYGQGNLDDTLNDLHEDTFVTVCRRHELVQDGFILSTSYISVFHFCLPFGFMPIGFWLPAS